MVDVSLGIAAGVKVSGWKGVLVAGGWSVAVGGMGVPDAPGRQAVRSRTAMRAVEIRRKIEVVMVIFVNFCLRNKVDI